MRLGSKVIRIWRKNAHATGQIDIAVDLLAALVLPEKGSDASKISQHVTVSAGAVRLAEFFGKSQCIPINLNHDWSFKIVKDGKEFALHPNSAGEGRAALSFARIDLIIDEVFLRVAASRCGSASSACSCGCDSVRPRGLPRRRKNPPAGRQLPMGVCSSGSHGHDLHRSFRCRSGRSQGSPSMRMSSSPMPGLSEQNDGKEVPLLSDVSGTSELPARPLKVCVVSSEFIGPVKNGEIATATSALIKLFGE